MWRRGIQRHTERLRVECQRAGATHASGTAQPPLQATVETRRYLFQIELDVEISRARWRTGERHVHAELEASQPALQLALHGADRR